MKKKLLSAALILAALISFNVSAQQPANATDNVTEATSVKNVRTEKKDKAKKGDRKCDSGRKDARKGRQDGSKGQRPDFFKGITLTADQQTKLDALRPQRPEGTDAKAGKAAAGKDGIRKDGKDGRRHNGRGINAEYIENVKEILTPDQYVVFLENIVFRADNDSISRGQGNRPGRDIAHHAPRQAKAANSGSAAK